MKQSTIIKGVAILAVVLIHTLASLPGIIFYEFPQAFGYIFLDQLCRLSVPVFLGISGYGLTKKYGNILHSITPKNYLDFFKKRVLKLVPMYLLWSIGLWALFLYITPWYATATPTPLWQVIFLGRGDYHLYFIPLILQLYLLFPFLLLAVKRWKWVVLGLSIAIQASSFLFFQWQSSLASTPFFVTDLQQYSMFTSWISYFVFGIVLASSNLIKMRTAKIVMSLLFLASIFVLTLHAGLAIQNGVDPLHALKFTRLLIIPYGLSALFVGVAFEWEHILKKIHISSVLQTIGTNSFLLFLSHTVILRIIFASDIISPLQLGVALLFLVLMLAATYVLNKKIS